MPLTPRPLAPLALRLVEIPGIPRVRGVQAVGLARLPTLIRGGASPLRRAAEQHPAQHRDLLRQLRDPGIGLRERLLGPLGTLTPVRHISGVTGHRREGHVLQNTPSPSNTPRTAPGVSRTKPQPRRRPRLQTHAALTPHVTTGGHSDSARPPTGSPNTYSHVIDASGADITGHSTATVILVGRRRSPKRQNLRAVMGIVGKRAEPGDPPGGPVWAAIVESVDKPGLPNPYISVTDMPRQRLTRHPWSLSGGGASEVAGAICSGSSKLAEKIEVPIGRAIRAGADDAFLRPLRASARFNVSREHLRQLLIGEVVRDWAAWPEEAMIYPYGEERQEEFETELWPWRTFLAERRTFQGNMADASLNWWEYMQHTPSAYRTPLSIVFAFVATHNHFVLDRGGKVFKQSAPVIKLRQGAGEDDHLALLGLLNSSTACVTGQVPVIR